MSMPSTTTWTFKPSEPLALARCYADLEGTTLLHSGELSYLALNPVERVEVEPGCWEALEAALGPFEAEEGVPRWVGYLGYEMGVQTDFSASTPGALFYRPQSVICFNHTTQQATLYGKPIDFERVAYHGKTDLRVISQSDTLSSYSEKIAQIKELILAGEVYQVNLSQEFTLEGNSDPFTLFEKVSRVNPAPFSAFVQCGDFALVSSSPERFLKRQKEHLETRPIKGTAPRGKGFDEDKRIREGLLSSEKERAELLMITDLMRNDLGRVALPGSVRVRELCRLEGYTNVFHLLSIIEAKSRMPSIPLIRALFPGGSVTGCPKLRALEAISRFEKRPRGVYTGSIGYFAANGDFDFNIAIRTLVVHKNRVQMQLGGAITLDSDPVKEYEETLHKGASLFQVLEADAHSLL